MRRWWLAVALLSAASPARADLPAAWQGAADALVAQGVSGVSLRTLPDGVELVARGADRVHPIASVTKLLLAGVALSRWGAEHHFHTDVFATGVRGSTAAVSVDALFVRGTGDPFLLRDEWAAIAAALPLRELRGDVVVDDGYFAEDPGIRYERVPNPYNAPNAALSAEFNRIAVVVDERGAAPAEGTRLTPFTRFELVPTRSRVYNVDERLVGDTLHVKIRGPLGKRAYTLGFNIGHQRGAAAYYAGHLLAASLADVGRLGKRVPQIRRGATPADATLLYRFTAPRSLAEVLEALLRYSNNFIANQLLLALGAEAQGAPATAAKGRATLAETLRDLDATEEIELADGSGLDPKNRASARALTRYLTAAHAKQPQLVALLPVRAGGAARAKTGTFREENVRAMAGYLLDRCGAPYATFAFLCDGRCSRRTVQLYDRTLRELAADAPAPLEACDAPLTDTSTRTHAEDE